MVEQAHRRHFRGRPRPARVLPVEFAAITDDGQAPATLLRAETRNIGVGGAFIVPQSTEHLLPVGSRLVLRLAATLPDIVSEVRWVAEPPLERGMGLRFLPLDPADFLLLSAHLAGEPEPSGRQRNSSSG